MHSAAEFLLHFGTKQTETIYNKDALHHFRETFHVM